MASDYIINIENLNKSYSKKRVLHDISFKVAEGCIFGILGPSGCGKSTLVKIISGILRKDSGVVRVIGKDMPNLEVMSEVGYMAQSAALYLSLSAYDNLKFFGSLYGLKKAQLEERISYVSELTNLSGALKEPVSTFSGGMKQRLSLAIALISNPKLLILDEPTVGIDPVLRKSIWDELRNLSKKGVSIIVTTHVMDEAQKCDKLLMLRAGKILATGTPSEIKALAGVNSIEEAFIYFGKEVDSYES